MRTGISLSLSIALSCVGASGLEHTVDDGQQLLAAATVAAAGDVIVLADGEWADQRLEVKLTGSSGAPITLRAQTRGKAVFNGESSLEIVGAHVVIDGLTFRGGHLETGHVLRIRGEHCRITRCSIVDYNPRDAKTRYHWLSLHGRNHRVDHCRFSGQNHSGSMLVVWLDADADGEVGGHRIDLNHFGPRARGNGNGFETMRIGDSKTSMTNANCMVTMNLFENCDGEIELISNKSCQNTYFANTIDRCAGALTLRHGNRCVVGYNTIIGGGKKGTGGIRVVGEGHEILNNHIEGTDGRVDGAIALSAGVPNAKLHEHAQVRDVLIEGNTFLNNRGQKICQDHGKGSHGRTLLPEDVTIRDNRESVAATAVPHRLKVHDVGPESRIEPHPNAISNTHDVGEVDILAMTAFIVPNPKSLEGIVIDETEAELVGEWGYSTHTPPYVGIGYLHDRKDGKGEKSVTYHFDPPKSGVYDVQVSHCFNIRRSTNTPITIAHADGADTIRINQQETPPIDNLFRSLGEFRFEAGKPGFIWVSNEGTDGKYVIADAVRFVPK